MVGPVITLFQGIGLLARVLDALLYCTTTKAGATHHVCDKLLEAVIVHA